MILDLNERRRSNYTNTSGGYGFLNVRQKPIEIYFFLEPLCSNCWYLEPYLKKLSIEYGRFFTIRPVISGHLRIVHRENTNDFKPLNMYNQNKNEAMSTHDYPSITMAIKAAELQGKNAGRLFLRKIQENFFLKKQNVTDITILIKCAIEANLDVQEFINDLNSVSVNRAFHCDLKITKEMKVKDTPTVVFFNQMMEEDGVKISGFNSYDIYELILSEILQRKPQPSKKPSLEDFLAYYGTVSQNEISIVYDWPRNEVDREMKKLELKQRAKKKVVKDETFWKYIQQESIS